jgi:MFS family permease
MVLVGVRMKKEFLLSETQWGLVTGAFALAYALFEIPSGILGDIKGQRSTLIRIVIW